MSIFKKRGKKKTSTEQAKILHSSGAHQKTFPSSERESDVYEQHENEKENLIPHSMEELCSF